MEDAETLYPRRTIAYPCKKRLNRPSHPLRRVLKRVSRLFLCYTRSIYTRSKYTRSIPAGMHEPYECCNSATYHLEVAIESTRTSACSGISSTHNGAMSIYERNRSTNMILTVETAERIWVRDAGTPTIHRRGETPSFLNQIPLAPPLVSSFALEHLLAKSVVQAATYMVH
jgi:hypothetical protein